MSYNDGDVSMASFRDDSFEMSVDHDPIDIVWRSTQVPAMESLLEESKRKSFQTLKNNLLEIEATLSGHSSNIP